MPNVGDSFNRKRGTGPKRILLVGQRDGFWIAQDIEQVETPFEINGHRLAVEYGSDGDVPVELTDDDAWAKAHKDWLRNELQETVRRDAARRAAEMTVEEIFDAEEGRKVAPPAQDDAPLTPEQAFAEAE